MVGILLKSEKWLHRKKIITLIIETNTNQLILNIIEA